MLMRWNDLGFAGFADANRLFHMLEPAAPSRAWQALQSPVPQLRLRDLGEELQVSLEVPGFRQEDIQVSFEQNTLQIRGERSAALPEGYAVQRRERGGLSFARTLALPTRVTPEKISAVLKDGMLELRLPKAAEERPRTITVSVA
jgi:HSP20 family protein